MNYFIVVFSFLFPSISFSFQGMPHSRIHLASSVCLVADSIQIHNSRTTLWWSTQKTQPHVLHRPRTPHYHKQWMVFMSELQYHVSKTDVIEIAHAMPDGTCRFILHSAERSSLKLSSPAACKPNQNGESGLFSTDFDFITNRRQITAGSSSVSENEHLFLGSRGRFLHLTTIRSKYMKWWKIIFRPNKQC